MINLRMYIAHDRQGETNSQKHNATSGLMRKWELILLFGTTARMVNGFQCARLLFGCASASWLKSAVLFVHWFARFVPSLPHLVVAELAVGISRALGLGRPRWSRSRGNNRPRRRPGPCPRSSYFDCAVLCFVCVMRRSDKRRNERPFHADMQHCNTTNDHDHQ